jgi:hypothetical protein
MTTIYEDLQANKVNLALDGGWTASREFIADGVVGNPDAIGYEAIRNGSVPKPGTPHPTIPNVIVQSVDAESIGANQVRLTISYGPFSSGGGSTSPDEEAQTQISIGGSVQTVQTNEYFKRNARTGKETKELIELEYEYADGKGPGGENPIKTVATVDKQVPVIVARLSRTESEHPGQKARDFVGKLNKKTFIGGKPGTWLCTNIGGSSNNGGQSYQVDYEFMYAIPDAEESFSGWNKTVFFTDPKTGLIPEDIKDQKKAKLNVKVQESADFNKLKLGPFTQGNQARAGTKRI